MGRIVNGIKHMCVLHDDNFKKKSLEDNVYFTLLDIFWNCDSADVCMISNKFNTELTGNVSYEDRTDSFQYTKMLQQPNEIISWLDRITPAYFEFMEVDFETVEEYILFDDWWKHFKELIQILKNQRNTCSVETSR